MANLPQTLKIEILMRIDHILLPLPSVSVTLKGLAIVPLMIDIGVTDQDGANAACMALPWLLATGFSLTFSALFTKTQRINQLMQGAARCKRMKLTATDVMKPMVALLMINVVVLIVWTVVDPLQRKTTVVAQDSFLRDIETYGRCTSEYSAIFLAILCAINLGSLIFAVFQAYKARNVAVELQESNYIFMAMIFILLVSFIAIPVIIIASDNVTAFYFVTTVLIFVVCASILLLIFIPKVMALRRKERSANVSASGGSSIAGSSASTAEEGIGILSTPQGLAELETENRELKRLLAMKQALENGDNDVIETTRRNSFVRFDESAVIEDGPRHTSLEVVGAEAGGVGKDSSYDIEADGGEDDNFLQLMMNPGEVKHQVDTMEDRSGMRN